MNLRACPFSFYNLILEEILIHPLLKRVNRGRYVAGIQRTEDHGGRYYLSRVVRSGATQTIKVGKEMFRCDGSWGSG